MRVCEKEREKVLLSRWGLNGAQWLHEGRGGLIKSERFPLKSVATGRKEVISNALKLPKNKAMYY